MCQPVLIGRIQNCFTRLTGIHQHARGHAQVFAAYYRNQPARYRAQCAQRSDAAVKQPQSFPHDVIDIIGRVAAAPRIASYASG